MSECIDGTHYHLTGPENAPVVALVHGVGINYRIWQHYQPILSARYRVLSYDLYGHGDSSLPAEPLSLRVFARQLAGLLDALGIERCAVVGFSMGGMINRRFAMDYPQRARALVVMNSPHERSPQAQKRVEERAARTADGGPEATMQASLERWFTPGFLHSGGETVEQVRAWVLANEPLAYARSRQVLAAGVVELIRPEPPLTLPTLVMTCEHDSGSTPAMAHAIAAEIRAAKTVIVPQLQHLGMLEKPSRFITPMAAFLDDVLLSVNE